jgi:hypothetical protein
VTEAWSNVAKFLPGFKVERTNSGRWNASWSPNATNLFWLTSDSEMDLLHLCQAEVTKIFSDVADRADLGRTIRASLGQHQPVQNPKPKEQVKPKTPENPWSKRKFG